MEISVKDLLDLERQEHRFKSSTDIVVRIEEDISMEKYLLVLERLQQLRLQYGADVRTHFYE